MPSPVSRTNTDHITVLQQTSEQTIRSVANTSSSTLCSVAGSAPTLGPKSFLTSVKEFFISLFNCITCGLFASKSKKKPDADAMQETKPTIPPKNKADEKTATTSKKSDEVADAAVRSQPQTAKLLSKDEENASKIKKSEAEYQESLASLPKTQAKAEADISLLSAKLKDHQKELLATRAQLKAAGFTLEARKKAEAESKARLAAIAEEFRINPDAPTQPVAPAVKPESKIATLAEVPKAETAQRENVRQEEPKKPEFADVHGRKFSDAASKELIAYYRARGILSDPAMKIEVDVETFEGLYGLKLDKVLRDDWAKDKELPEISLKPLIDAYSTSRWKEVEKFFPIDFLEGNDPHPTTLSYRDAFKFYIGWINFCIDRNASKGNKTLDEARVIRTSTSFPIVKATGAASHQGHYLPSMQVRLPGNHSYVPMRRVVFQVLKDKGLIFDFYDIAGAITFQA